jgi:monoterpene epsilon-lactone hydrolase
MPERLVGLSGNSQRRLDPIAAMGMWDPQVSPLYGDFSGCPPITLHVGEDEVLLDDTRRIARSIQAAGGDGEVHIWSGMTHVFPTSLAVLRAAAEALDLVGKFVNDVFI